MTEYLNKIAETLVCSVMQHAVAQSAYLSVEPDLELFALAAENDDIEFQYAPATGFRAIAESIVAYVKRTGSAVFLADVDKDGGEFANDEHLVKAKPKSLLCLPIVIQQQIRGVIYLENDVTGESFTQQQLSVIEMLLSLAAVSFEAGHGFDALTENEAKYQLIFDNSPVPIWEDDFSAIKLFFDDLRNSGVSDIEAYLDQHPESVQKCAELAKVADVNTAALKLHGATTKAELLAGLINTFTSESLYAFRDELIQLWHGNTRISSDAVVKTLSGERRNVSLNLTVCPGYEESLSKVFVSLVDITQRKETELQLKQALAFSEGVINAIPDILIEVNAEGRYLNLWTRRPELLAAPREELIGRTAREVLPPEAADVCMNAIHQADEEGVSLANILRLDLPEGTCWFEQSLSKLPSEDPDAEVSFLVLSRDVTERMHMQEELRASEQRVQAILDQTFQFIGLLSTDGTTLKANRAALNFVGIEENDVVGKPFWETPWWTHSIEQQHQLQDAIRRAAGGEFIRYEATHPDKDGNIHTVDFSLSPIIDSTGRVVQLIPEGRDITEFKKVEQERQVQAEFLANMDRVNRAIQAAGDLETMMHDVLEVVVEIFHCDRVFLLHSNDTSTESWSVRMQRSSPAYSGPTALHEDQLLEECIQAVTQYMLHKPAVLQGDVPKLWQLSSDLKGDCSGKSLICEALFPKVSPPWIFGLQQCSYQRSWNKTEEQLFEEVGRRLTDALTGLLVQRNLRESEHRLVEAQHLAHLGNWELDLGENRLTWSDEIYHIFKLDRENFGATFDAFLEIIHPEDREKVSAAYTESLNNRQPYDIVHRILLPDNQIRYVREMCEHVYDTNGKPIRSVGTVQDITEQKLKEDELRHYRLHLEEEVQQRTEELQIAKEKAELANQAKSVFLANMSHELRTPLNAILGYAYILKKRVGLKDPMVEDLTIMERSGEHLLMLINDILDLAKFEAGKLEIYSATFHLPSFMRQILDIVLSQAEARKLTLTYESLSSLPSVIQADETRLRQILLNLLSNAVKYTQQGSVALTVQVLDQEPVTKEAVILRFSVQDTGIGISTEHLKHIFKPFEQVGEVSFHSGGSGLGLAISQKLVQEMGGQLQVESELGRGSTFWFDVPVSVTGTELEEDIPKVDNILGYQGKHRKVLVIDDKLYNRLLLVDLLEPLGFEVKTLEDGQQAMTMALEWQPDAIVIDLVMPIKSGFEAVREMRQRPELKDLFIIAASASVADSDKGKSIDVGCDKFLPKPIKPYLLLDLLAKRFNLEWIYAEEMTEPKPILIAPPLEELQLLHQLVEDGQIFAIQDYAKRLEKQDEAYEPFARQLHKLAKRFDMEHIEAFITQFLS